MNDAICYNSFSRLKGLILDMDQMIGLLLVLNFILLAWLVHSVYLAWGKELHVHDRSIVLISHFRLLCWYNVNVLLCIMNKEYDSHIQMSSLLSTFSSWKQSRIYFAKCLKADMTQVSVEVRAWEDIYGETWHLNYQLWLQREELQNMRWAM